MNEYTIHTSGPIQLPNGVTVGDEFRIAGKCRVTAIAEDLIDSTSHSDNDQSITPGSRRYTLVVSDLRHKP